MTKSLSFQQLRPRRASPHAAHPPVVAADAANAAAATGYRPEVRPGAAGAAATGHPAAGIGATTAKAAATKDHTAEDCQGKRIK